MIQTWFKIFFRNSKKNWLNLVINILGLTVGFAGLLIVLLYLNDEENLEDSTKLIANLKISLKSNKIIYYWILFLLENKDNQDKIMILFCNCFQNKIIKYNTLKYGLIEFLVDYNNFKWDYPNINNVLKMFIKICKMKLFLTSDNINYIFSKSSCDEKENIL